MQKLSVVGIDIAKQVFHLVGMCSGSRTSAAVLTNIALSQLTLIENIAGVLLTLGNNVLRLW